MLSHTVDITTCPACNAQWAGRTVEDGASLIAEHMDQLITGATLDIEVPT